jgi:hypothetical protein
MDIVVAAGHVALPVCGANATTVITMPESRWILWANGPLRGPAVRFWTILAFSLLIALVLGSLPISPIGRIEWVLLALGLTQVHVGGALTVVLWFFLMAWRGRQNPDRLAAWRFDFVQLSIIVITVVVLGILIAAVGEGLLGSPEMFIVGNQSSATHLNWFQPRVDDILPAPWVVSISVWFYRLFMLLWALWLANALLRWLKWGWMQFTFGGGWRQVWNRRHKKQAGAEANSSA